MRYIRRVRVDHPGTHSQHITYVQWSSTTTGTLTTASRADVAADIDTGRQQYRSHNDRTGDEAQVAARTSAGGTRYITTIAGGRETNNLLSLPRF